MEFARDFHEICPDAIIVNYTNPMSTLTSTLAHLCDNPVVGLCHAYFETKDVIQKLFGLPDWKRLSVEIAGMNHFTWVTDFRIDGRSGYPLLRERIGKGSIRDILPAESADELGITSAHALFAELFDAYGYLPYPADRHISEFVPFALTGPDEKGGGTLKYCQLRRTSIAQRENIAGIKRQQMLQSIELLPAERGTQPPKSRETGAEMIRGYLDNHPVMDAVNTLNRGQVPGLPLGACVETLGVVDGFGVRPILVPSVPEPLLELMRPQAMVAKWIVESALSGDRTLLYQALYQDPQCSHLKPAQARSLADELFGANRRYTRAVWGN
jgi:alpha-galactosidase